MSEYKKIMHKEIVWFHFMGEAANLMSYPRKQKTLTCLSVTKLIYVKKRWTRLNSILQQSPSVEQKEMFFTIADCLQQVYETYFWQILGTSLRY